MLFVLIAVWFWPSASDSDSRTIKVASAKGRVIAAQMRSMSSADQSLLNFAMQDVGVSALLGGKDVQLLESQRLGVSASAEIEACGDCTQLTFYNYTDGGTIEAIYSFDSERFVRQWADVDARPNASGYLVERVVNIAADDAAVQNVLGDLRKAEVAMIPMSTWLADDACSQDWCVDLTFHDPSGSSKIFHTVVNMHTEQVARTFFTRGRAARAMQETDPENDEGPKYTDGCHEQYGWSVCWEMTADDGVNFYDGTFDETLIFSSIKIGQVEAYYPSWPGGYRDEIGFASTVPPKFNTKIIDLGDGFEVRQLFTEPFNWPNCICCYRYEEVIHFGEDGSFSPTFVSQGPGCDELSEYRPFWRINLALNGEENDEAWVWDEREWLRVANEQDISIYDSLSLEGQKLATFDGEMSFRWEPELTDPLALDEGRFFIVQSEGEQGIEPGPADTYDPVRSYVDGESLQESDTDLSIWYVPVLKTKRGNPWWCQPDPEPDFSPCHTTLRIIPAGKLVQPTAEELAALETQPTPVPEQITPAAVAVDAVATIRPTPRAIEGETVEEVVLNSGCGACHAIGALGEAGKVGPSLNNIGSLAHSRVPGQSAETYLTNSILYPNIFLAPDCPNGECRPDVMPGTYYLTLSDTQIETLVDYMLTLQDDSPQPIADSSNEVGQVDRGDSAENGAITTPTTIDNTLLLSVLGVLLVLIAIAAFVLLRGRQTPEE
ncbi:MAG: c-type cytochrome [Candidatus Promineifilaceae bacterium]